MAERESTAERGGNVAGDRLLCGARADGKRQTGTEQATRPSIELTESRGALDARRVTRSGHRVGDVHRPPKGPEQRGP